MDQKQAQAQRKVGLFSLSSYSRVVTQMAIDLLLIEFMAGGSNDAAEAVGIGEG